MEDCVLQSHLQPSRCYKCEAPNTVVDCISHLRLGFALPGAATSKRAQYVPLMPPVCEPPT